MTSGDSQKPNRDYGATSAIVNLSTEELSKKLERLEYLLENQRKFLEDHDIKIQETENAINKLIAEQQEKEKQTDEGKAVIKSLLLCL